VREVFIPDTDVYEDEVNLNHRLIFPILQSLARSSQDVRFLPGETRLKAVAYELELLLHDTSHYYNADATFTYNSHQLEMALLETTGKLHAEDKPKETKDYVKAGYGVLSMLHRIGRIYKYADFELFKKLGVYFIQVTRKRLQDMFK
jgi:plasmid replication initiation protein